MENNEQNRTKEIVILSEVEGDSMSKALSNDEYTNGLIRIYYEIISFYGFLCSPQLNLSEGTAGVSSN